MLRRIGIQRIIRKQLTSLTPIVQFVNCNASRPFSILSKQPVNQYKLSCCNWQKHPHTLSACHFYSTDNEHQSQNDEKSKQALLPKLLDKAIDVAPPFLSFFAVTFKAIKLKNQLDNEFSLDDFIDGSKKAVEVISDKLASSDFDGLRGMVSDELIDELRDPIGALTDEQRSHIRVFERDIVGQFVSYINIENQNVDIYTIIHILRNCEKTVEDVLAKKSPLDFMKRAIFVNENYYILNYKFSKNFSEPNDDWIVTFLNHASVDVETGHVIGKKFENKEKK